MQGILKTVKLPNTLTSQIKFLIEGFYKNKLNIKQTGIIILNLYR
jgi:hypothetical protein